MLAGKAGEKVTPQGTVGPRGFARSYQRGGQFVDASGRHVPDMHRRQHGWNRPPARGDDRKIVGQRFEQHQRLALVRVDRRKTEDIGGGKEGTFPVGVGEPDMPQGIADRAGLLLEMLAVFGGRELAGEGQTERSGRASLQLTDGFDGVGQALGAAAESEEQHLTRPAGARAWPEIGTGIGDAVWHHYHPARCEQIGIGAQCVVEHDCEIGPAEKSSGECPLSVGGARVQPLAQSDRVPVQNQPWAGRPGQGEDKEVAPERAAFAGGGHVVQRVTMPAPGKPAGPQPGVHGGRHLARTPAANVGGVARELQRYVADRDAKRRQAFDQGLHHQTLPVQGRRRLGKDEQLHRRLGKWRGAGKSDNSMSGPSAKSQPGVPWSTIGCALAGVAVFQFCGNASRGYIDTASLFYWWGFQWVNPTSETQHGGLILALSAWLFWRNLGRAESGERKAESGRHTADSGGRTANGKNRKSEIQNPKLAASAMLGGLALHLFGYFVQQARLSIVALLLFAWGVLALAGGRRWGRAALFPLAFLLFAVPVNFLDTAGFWLRLWVINASYGLAHCAGFDVMRSGTQLFAPDGAFQYDVAAACSGVRSLMALLALSLLGGYLYFRAWWLRGLMLLLSLPFTYVGNVVRITAVVFTAQWFGQKAGGGVHEWAGFLVFVIVLGLVLATIAIIRRCWPQTAALEAPATGPRWAPPEYAGPPWGVLVAVVTGALAVAAGTRWIDARATVAGAGVRLAAGQVDPVELPTFLGNAWIGRRAEVTAFEREILPPDTGYSRKRYVSLDDPGHSVFLSVVLSGRDRSSIHRPELCLVGQGWTIGGAAVHRFRDPSRAGGDFPATVLHVHREAPGPAGRRAAPPEIVAYWFVGPDRVVAAYWQRMWFDALARLRGHADRWAYVLAQTDARDGEAAALARIQGVLDGTLPAFQAP